jgi:hypothetical protein
MMPGHNAMCTCSDCEASKTGRGHGGFGLVIEFNDRPPVITDPVQAAELALDKARRALTEAEHNVLDAMELLEDAKAIADGALKRPDLKGVQAAELALDKARRALTEAELHAMGLLEAIADENDEKAEH